MNNQNRKNLINTEMNWGYNHPHFAVSPIVGERARAVFASLRYNTITFHKR